MEDLRPAKDRVFSAIGTGKDCDSRISRPLKSPEDIQVEVEMMNIDAVDETAEDPLLESLPPREASLYRAIVARVNFLASDRSDVQFASKECSRRMSDPRHCDWGAIKRIGRYLACRPRAIQWFK